MGFSRGISEVRVNCYNMKLIYLLAFIFFYYFSVAAVCYSNHKTVVIISV